MGKEIVYCTQCGSRLHQSDFDRGKASLVENRPYCDRCRPADPPQAKKATPRSPAASPRIPQRISTTRLPVLAPSTTRRHAGSGGENRRALYLGLVAAGGALALLAAFGVQPSGGGPPAPPPGALAGSSSAPPLARASAPVPPPPAAARTIPQDRVGNALRTVAELEALAVGGADPEALLVSCEQARERVRGTPYEVRLRELEARLLERKREREREQQVARALEDARKILSHPRAFERKADVLALLRAVRPAAGPRLAEVDRLIDQAERLREEPEAVSGAVPPPAPAPAEPPALDARQVNLRETFDQGPGPFRGGIVVEGGWNGSKALAVPAEGVLWEKLFTRPVSSTLTIRFLLNPLFDARQVEIVLWSPKRRQNYRYHLRNLRAREWNRVEFRVAEARIGWNLEGPSAEGDLPDNIKIYFDDKVAGGRLLLDDFEILE